VQEEDSLALSFIPIVRGCAGGFDPPSDRWILDCRAWSHHQDKLAAHPAVKVVHVATGGSSGILADLSLYVCIQLHTYGQVFRAKILGIVTHAGKTARVG
jgi:hypothetical protein